MAILLVTYDLRKENHSKLDYEGLYAFFDTNDAKRVAESVYALETTRSPEHIYNELSPHLDENDRLAVFTLASPFFGRGMSEGLNWLQTKLEVG